MFNNGHSPNYKYWVEDQKISESDGDALLSNDKLIWSNKWS